MRWLSFVPEKPCTVAAVALCASLQSSRSLYTYRGLEARCQAFAISFCGCCIVSFGKTQWLSQKLIVSLLNRKYSNSLRRSSTHRSSNASKQQRTLHYCTHTRGLVCRGVCHTAYHLRLTKYTHSSQAGAQFRLREVLRVNLVNTLHRLPVGSTLFHPR